MRRLPSVNHLVAQISQQVRDAAGLQKEAAVSPPVYHAPVSVEIQKVANACRESAASITVGDVEEFAQRILGRV